MEVEDSTRPAHIPDIDKDDESDPLCVSCYVNDIYANLRKAEVLFIIYYSFFSHF